MYDFIFGHTLHEYENVGDYYLKREKEKNVFVKLESFLKKIYNCGIAITFYLFFMWICYLRKMWVNTQHCNFFHFFSSFGIKTLWIVYQMFSIKNFEMFDIFVHTITHTQVCIYAHIYMCVCVHIYIYIYVCEYLHLFKNEIVKSKSTQYPVDWVNVTILKKSQTFLFNKLSFIPAMGKK